LIPERECARTLFRGNDAAPGVADSGCMNPTDTSPDPIHHDADGRAMLLRLAVATLLALVALGAAGSLLTTQ
jgi:hypothetical protein